MEAKIEQERKEIARREQEEVEKQNQKRKQAEERYRQLVETQTIAA